MALTGNFGRVSGGESLSAATAPVTTQVPQQTYAPQTDFSGTAGGSSDGSTLVPGIPDVYIFGAFRHEFFKGRGMSMAAQEQFIRENLQKSSPKFDQMLQQVTGAWGGVPEGDKQKYIAGAKSGNPWDPTLDPGNYGTYEKEQGAVKDEAEQKAAFEDWQEKDVARAEELAGLAAQGDQRALDQLRVELGGIKDPRVAEFLGEIESQAAKVYADPKLVAAQQEDLDRLAALRDPTISAQEKLMLEMSRRENDTILRGQREALADNLQQRGLYGSGSELTMNAINQQGAASRHAMEQLRANAQAQTRAMEALSQHTDLAGVMRNKDVEEKTARASAADLTAQWNKNFRQAYDDAKLAQENKAAGDKRGQTWDIYGAKLKTNRSPVDDAFKLAELRNPTQPGGAVDRSRTFGGQRDVSIDEYTDEGRFKLGEDRVTEVDG